MEGLGAGQRGSLGAASATASWSCHPVQGYRGETKRKKGELANQEKKQNVYLRLGLSEHTTHVHNSLCGYCTRVVFVLLYQTTKSR